MDPDPPRASVIIPCYNAEATIARALEDLMRFLEEDGEELDPCEIIVVDDGSTDRTREIVSEGFPGVRLLAQDVNRGKGAAVKTGMLEARGRYRIFIDADMPFDLRSLPRMVHYLSVKEFDVVIGSRVGDPGLHLTRRSPLRRFASAIFTAIVSRIVVTGVRDTQCGMKGFRAGAAEYLFSQSRVQGFAFDVEILYLAYKNDLEIKRIPVRLVREDESTVSVLRHSPGMVLATAALPFRFHTGGYEMMERRDREDMFS